MLHTNAGSDTESPYNKFHLLLLKTRFEIKSALVVPPISQKARKYAIFQAFSLYTSHYLRSVRGDYWLLISASCYHPYFKSVIYYNKLTWIQVTYIHCYFNTKIQIFTTLIAFSYKSISISKITFSIIDVYSKIYLFKFSKLPFLRYSSSLKLYFHQHLTWYST